MDIFEATKEDIRLIQQIAFNTWPDTFKDILSREQIKYMLEIMYSTQAIQKQMGEGHQYLIITDGVNNLGYTSYEVNYKIDTTKIHKIYVLPEIQGKGAGRKLIEEVEIIAKQKDNVFLTLNVNRNNKAVQFYEHLGFKRGGNEDIDIGNGFLMEDYIMVKKIKDL